MSFLRPCLHDPRTSWSLHNASTEAVVATMVLTAFNRDSRNQGLLGRDGLPDGAALVLAPCSAVHTWFMRFSLDLVFVNRGGIVLAVKRDVRPWRMAVRLGAFAVVELSAGAAAAIAPGDRLSLVPAA